MCPFCCPPSQPQSRERRGNRALSPCLPTSVIGGVCACVEKCLCKHRCVWTALTHGTTSSREQKEPGCPPEAPSLPLAHAGPFVSDTSRCLNRTLHAAWRKPQTCVSPRLESGGLGPGCGVLGLWGPSSCPSPLPSCWGSPWWDTERGGLPVREGACMEPTFGVQGCACLLVLPPCMGPTRVLGRAVPRVPTDVRTGSWACATAGSRATSGGRAAGSLPGAPSGVPSVCMPMCSVSGTHPGTHGQEHSTPRPACMNTLTTAQGVQAG